ncbi:uncharacterized protein LOC123679720 [Harmonia axyridis]|uniref:uncharacterized protein LOC123679720 n=1 Tax=Harmonia axyridis TaxID=115357 RepID=UPI001E2775D9|nr:uncharacterized protein LOC123679720 [Harmonia axyridis]
MANVWLWNIIALCVLITGKFCQTDFHDLYNFFYKEIGCVEYDKNGAFHCPEYPSKNGSCRFLNQYVPSGEKIDQELLKGSCIPECICGEDGHFICPGTDCGLLSKEGCHSRNSLDTCCPEGLVCGDDIAKCEVEGKTYKEGEKFYLEKSCEVCVCDKGFKKGSPFCRPRKCNLEINRLYELADHDAPVYLKDDICCPTTWIKNEGEDELITIIADLGKEACKFGTRDIIMGQGFRRNISRFGTEMTVKCLCNTPPFVICREEVTK